MKAPTLRNDHDIDGHFLARMEAASVDERDAVLADLAVRALAGDELAARTIRALMLPACRRIGAGRDAGGLSALVDAACQEVLDWAVSEGHATL
ncbi:MAG: hypothetical protein JOZ04_14390 [Acidimicrobiia bacterium]|nr:hypothetical protein [Acidimicrobiia bacterium]